MNDTVIMENYLLVLKSNVEVFVHGTLESNFDDTQKLLKDSLNTTLSCQRRTYEIMTQQGMYNEEKVEKKSIVKVLNKLPKWKDI